jgi:acetate kinase
MNAIIHHSTLRSIKQLYGSKLRASDGEMGHVSDFYFDDQQWTVRYVVADTGSWIPGRLVLIPPHAIGIGSLRQEGNRLLAHLGGGASLAAIRNGKSVDTSMSLTPAAGFPMSTRSGDLDPGLVYYLARTEKMSAKQFDEMVNFKSGLLGISETSSDMHDLLKSEGEDVRAAQAVAIFCYQVRKWIAAFAGALGGLDTLVFAGGIGENAPTVRARICDELGFLGIELDQKRNAEHAPCISTGTGHVKVRVIRTDEELMIAKSVMQFLQLNPIHENNI